jgi:HTH-type transcriptional regulator/antitoxin HigA
VSTFEGFVARRPGHAAREGPRIARGWTQRRLAEALGVAEQQVQRDESTDYRSASLARICDVAAALDVAVTEKAELQGPHAA